MAFLTIQAEVQRFFGVAYLVLSILMLRTIELTNQPACNQCCSFVVAVMWRFSNQDVSQGAQTILKAPKNGRVGPPKRSERSFTNPSGCVLIVVAWAIIGFTFVVPYAIGEPDPDRLVYGTDYKGMLSHLSNSMTRAAFFTSCLMMMIS